MFNIGLGELVFIALLVLIFIGPERLPKLMRQLGEMVYQLRVVIAQFNREFAEELRPLQEIQALREELNPVRQIGSVIDQVAQPPATSGRGLMPPPPGSATTAPALKPGAHPMTQLSQARQAAAATTPPPATAPTDGQAASPAHETSHER
ncbi:MAG: Sec-independent protein translocase protein TatB [Anaerolineae bacterium]|nr:Sec-independent protein translocase protein TatB [Caldilineales bacterium]MCX7851653.1 Sec-independent protein translocase protein TatB [Caldilineales bacterium]MDW8269897.1 Sec-independent protein translocase protein TatB [Anaerolineae bacterium]